LPQSAEPYKSAEFPGYKGALLAQGAPSDALEITGLYYSDEPAASMLDLGTLRAQATAREFADDLVPERIKISSRKLERPAPLGADGKFVATDFQWVALIAPMSVAPNAPLVFNPNSSEPITGPEFAAMKAALGKGMPTQQLSIVGQWFEGESEALGLARAKAVQALLADVIAPERTVLSAAFAGAAPTAPFAAAMFQWLDTAPADSVPSVKPVEVASLDVYFASNSATVVLEADTQAQIDAFVAAAAGKSAVVIGHTDSTGVAGKNTPLGQRRAQALVELLRKAGFTGALRPDTRSDAQPKGDNATEAGKKLNRRAEARVE
jgi:hypothetical protein